MKGDLLDAMKAIKKENELHTIVLLLTDIMTEGSQMLVVSDDANTVEKAFNIKLANSQVWMPGVMSRKKQVVPVLSKAFK
jgi:manganese-dependent inorganic pyrophosphatase